MAEDSWPNTPHNARALTEEEYESLVRAGFVTGLGGGVEQLTPVYATGIAPRQVFVRSFRNGNIRGFYWESGSTDTALAIAANAGATRFDLIVLRLDRDADWIITAAVITGVSGSPAPTPTQSTGSTGVYEIPLAIITVGTGVSFITDANVSTIAQYTVFPQVAVKNTASKDAYAPTRRGQILWHDSNDQGFIADGANWRLFVDEGGSAALTSASGWNAAGSTVRRRNGFATLNLRGVLRSAAGSTLLGSLMATIPANYRPIDTYDVSLALHGSLGIRDLVAQVLPSGTITSTIHDAVQQNDRVYGSLTYPVAY